MAISLPHPVTFAVWLLGATTIAALPVLAGESASAPAKPYEAAAAEIRSMLDPKADPCQSFYQYACGGWLAKTALPADKSSFGRSSELADRNRNVLHTLLEELAKAPGDDPDNRLLGAYYASCMDEGAIEKAGAAPLAPLFAEIAKATDIGTLLHVAGKLQRDGIEVLLTTFVEGDFKDPNLSIAYLSQGGIGLPDRDYYLKEDAESKSLLADYQGHIAKMLGLAGEAPEDAARHAAAIVAFETALAKASLPRAEMRDPTKLYHRVDPAGLTAMSGGLSFAPFFAGLGQPNLTLISAAPASFFEGLAAALRTTDLETLRADLRWLTIHARADELSQAFVAEQFAFFDKRLQGQKELQVRWKRCVTATDDALGFALGRAFVERSFPGDSKKIAVEMIHDIERSFDQGLGELAWMDDRTRTRAREKAGALVNKVGYPDKWRDYSALNVGLGAGFFANVSAAIRFETDRLLAKIGGPVDRTEWGMSPPTVNAYYNPLRNEMVFPAGILQQPYFSKDRPAAMNYGGIGMVMGHELTHGFDDQGRQFDATGSLREWWDPSAVARFTERTKCVSDLYSGFEVEPGVKLNGQLTLGENIADFGGVKASFRGWRAWAERNGKPAPMIEGFANDQLFFLGYAQGWCTLRSPEFSRMLVTVDPHSPPRFRVDGPLSNFPDFAQAFQCAEGTPMNLAKRCEVW